jgi:DNA-binding Lrp family transcriptional regulator
VERGGRANIRALFDKVSKQYGSSFTALYNTVRILEKEGYIKVNDVGREK